LGVDRRLCQMSIVPSYVARVHPNSYAQKAVYFVLHSVTMIQNWRLRQRL